MSDDEQNNSTSSSYSPQQRKAYYRKYLGKTKVLQEHVSPKTPATLRDLMTNIDTINVDEEEKERVNHTDEILLDSEVMSASSSVLKRCTETLNKDTSPYNHTEFADKILTYMRLRPETMSMDLYWPMLADDLLKCHNVTPRYSYLLGTLEPLAKKEIIRKKPRQRDAQVATKRPEKVQAVSKVEDGVEETVQKIKALVSHYYKINTGPLNFFKLILNPDNFGRTVENMLHVSFLVRDGYLSLVKDENGKLNVHPTSKEALAQAKKKGNEVNVQNVMSINAKQWQTLKEKYRVDKAMINFSTSGQT